MTDTAPLRAVQDYWDCDGLRQAIFDALAASGIAPDRLTIDDLAAFDQFHGGGKAATDRLAQLARLTSGLSVLDVGGGLGGPARTLAVQHGARVVVLDLAASYAAAGTALTALLGLGDRVAHVIGDALALPFADASFDVVWTQNSGMNIADKSALLAALRRVLRPRGKYVFQEPVAGPVQPPHFPLMWAEHPALHFLLTGTDLRSLTEATGFRCVAWDDVTAEASGGRAPASGPSIQSLVMGDRLAAIAEAGRRNRDEQRIVMVQAVFERA